MKYFLSAACLALLGLCLPAFGASNAQQEFDAAVRSKPDLKHGEQLFVICAACHASNGGGSPNGDVPVIAGQHPRVLARQLVNYRYGKRWDVRMERIADQHHLATARDIADVAAYVSGLGWQASAGLGNGASLQHGADLYSRLCTGCHGRSGQGEDGRTVPRVAGQHYEYLLRQMYDAIDNRRPNFTREHVNLLKRFERADLVAVADYLSRLTPSPAP